jgi:conjugal transfer pilus assembly protein TraK
MMSFRTQAALALALALALGAKVAFAEIPVVPATVLSDDGEVIPQPPRFSLPSVGQPAETPRILRSSYRPLEIEVEPGINQVLPIAIGHYNRIVTPYDTPFVQTVSDAVIEPHENVLYIASDQDVPVTLYITPDAGDESHAISLTLQPAAIPPIEAKLVLPGSSGAAYHSRKKAEKFETGHPYTESIKKMLRDIALGQVPEGFGLGPLQAGDMVPFCDQRGMKYEFLKGQYLRGHHFHISVGTIRNVSAGLLEVDETACLNGQIAAVATWPYTYLEPGQMAEIYVVLRRDLTPAPTTVRESLLEER